LQIQLSTHSFRIFYGESFSEFICSIVNALGEYDVGFELKWFDEFAIITPTVKVDRQIWHDILYLVFVGICEEDEDEDEDSENNNKTES